MLTPDQARTKFRGLQEEILDALGTASIACMPNETGFKIEGADIEDSEEINIHQCFTAFWLIKMIGRQGAATESDIDERVKLCLSIIGMKGSERTDKIALALFG